MNQQLEKVGSVSLGVFSDANSFEHWQRIAKMLSSSTLVPSQYQGSQGVANTLVALEFANRIGSSPLMVMQNLNIIDGKPSWSSAFVIASLEAAGFEIDYEIEQRGKKKVPYEYWEGPKGQRSKKTGSLDIEDSACRVVGRDSNGKEYFGPWISLEMAIKEGWYSRTGSKWQTMPDVMLRYRAASFFGRMYRPGLLMGLKSKEEIEDAVVIDEWGSADDTLIETLNQEIEEAEETMVVDETDEDLI